ncbi:hypothetical protein EV356DRAFT_527591 [Viridothelium virens]|uniref:Uncharacterized protein n=1 Tax=Viridothelium virens TaxID=1048519 RepID=A0A6A6GUI3_VIRVR|nr:hypothetical protein EV356DRAFT_527591 [Viridothelium virens]
MEWRVGRRQQNVPSSQEAWQRRQAPQPNSQDLQKLPSPPLYQDAATQLAGGESSSSVFHTQFACLSMHMSNRIRLMNFPHDCHSRRQDLVKSAWPKGVQGERVYGSSFELKLKNHPWDYIMESRFKSQSRRFMCGLLSGLFDSGWVLNTAVNIYPKGAGKDTLFLRCQNPAPQLYRWICISFMGDDFLYLIDAPDELQAALVQAYGERVQRHRARAEDTLVVGLNTVKARELLLILLECLEQHGFSLYTSLEQDTGLGDICGIGGNPSDTWYCKRQLDWSRGTPVYHT